MADPAQGKLETSEFGNIDLIVRRIPTHGIRLSNYS